MAKFSCAALLIVMCAAIAGPCRADDLSRIVSQCGKPDHDDSSLHDNPRPPLITRVVDYDKAHLRIAFLLDSPPGVPPSKPYNWRLIGFLNLDHWHPVEEGGDAALPKAEAADRLRQICKPGFVPPSPTMTTR
jgi:hypothetical protein